ncbi:succinylglutamate desuccinylase/aspartoacylase family protein [Paenibacillus sp. JTLBN-2024]
MTEEVKENKRLEELQKKHSELWEALSALREDQAERLLDSFSKQIRKAEADGNRQSPERSGWRTRHRAYAALPVVLRIAVHRTEPAGRCLYCIHLYVIVAGVTVDLTNACTFGLLDAYLNPEGEMKAMTVQNHTLAAGTSHAAPYYIVPGGRSGPVMMIVAGIHGNETASIHSARQLVEQLRNRRLRIARGKLIIVPVANPQAYRKRIRGVPDLNRTFPRRAETSGHPSDVPSDRSADENLQTFLVFGSS